VRCGSSSSAMWQSTTAAAAAATATSLRDCFVLQYLLLESLADHTREDTRALQKPLLLCAEGETLAIAVAVTCSSTLREENIKKTSRKQQNKGGAGVTNGYACSSASSGSSTTKWCVYVYFNECSSIG
jgi:hypothetical protein